MKVKSCKCEECHYNKDFKCEAGSIDIMSSAANRKVTNSTETCCSTFRLKS